MMLLKIVSFLLAGAHIKELRNIQGNMANTFLQDYITAIELLHFCTSPNVSNVQFAERAIVSSFYFDNNLRSSNSSGTSAYPQ